MRARACRFTSSRLPPSACRSSLTGESRSSGLSPWSSSCCGAGRSWAGPRTAAGGIHNVNARMQAFLLATVGTLIVSGIAAPNVRAAPDPTLSIVSPSPNALIGNGSPVVIVFAVTNFNLTDPGSGPSSPDSGHVDIFVDGRWTAKASVNSIVLALHSGPHTIRLQLVTNNGTSLSPDVTAAVAVIVTQGPAGGTPGLSIFSPREGALLGTDSTISFRVTNFVLVAPGGPVGVPNEGHVRVLLDAILPQAVLPRTGGPARAMLAPRDLPARGDESIDRGGGALTVNPHAGERPGDRQWHAGDRELRGGQLRPRAARPRRAGRWSDRRPRGPLRGRRLFTAAHASRARLAPTGVRATHHSAAARSRQWDAPQSRRRRIRPGRRNPGPGRRHADHHDRVPEARSDHFSRPVRCRRGHELHTRGRPWPTERPERRPHSAVLQRRAPPGAARVRSGVHRRHARREQHDHGAAGQQRRHPVESQCVGERDGPNPGRRGPDRIRTGDGRGDTHPRRHLARLAPPSA